MKNPVFRDLWKGVANASLARGYSILITAALAMIVGRWLGPAGQGVYAATTSWAALFAALGSLSLGQVAIHRATVRRGEPWLADLMGTLGVLAIALTFLCWSVALTLYFVRGESMFRGIPLYALMVGLLLIPFIIWEAYGSNLLVASGAVTTYNRAQLIGRTVSAVLMLACWLLQFGVTAALVVSVISQAIVACTGITYLLRLAGTKLRASFAEARVLLGGALRLHINSISVTAFTSLSVLMVNYYRGPEETGWYQLATTLTQIIIVIPTAAALLMSGQVAQLGPDGAWVYQRQVLLYVPLTMIVVGIIAAIAAPFVIPLVVGPKYIPAVPVFQLSLPMLLGLTLSVLMGSQWIGRGYFVIVSALSIGLAAVHIVASYLLVPRYGMYGAVYANLITWGIVAISNGIFALRCEVSYRHSLTAVEAHGAA